LKQRAIVGQQWWKTRRHPNLSLARKGKTHQYALMHSQQKTVFLVNPWAKEWRNSGEILNHIFFFEGKVFEMVYLVHRE